MGNPTAMFNSDLGCEWIACSVVTNQELSIMVPADHRPDMAGAIRVATFLLPAVRYINVIEVRYAASELEDHLTVVGSYICDETNRWLDESRNHGAVTDPH